jgi:hypothetical protein
MILTPKNLGIFGVGDVKLLEEYRQKFYPYLVIEAKKQNNVILREEKRRATIEKRKRTRREYFNRNQKMAEQRRKQRLEEKEQRMESVRQKKRSQGRKAKEFREDKKAFKKIAKEEIKKKEVDNPLSSNKLTLQERKEISDMVRNAKTLPEPEPQKYHSDRHR